MLKSAIFNKKTNFLNLNQNFQKQLLILGGIWLPLALLDYPGVLLANKGAIEPKSSVWKKKWLNSFILKYSCIFCLKYFYHMLHTCFMTYEVWWGMYYKIWTFNNVFNSVCQIICREKVRNEALDYESNPKFLFSTFGLYKFFFLNKYIYVKIATLLIFDIFYFGTNITQTVFSFITYPTVTWCFCFIFAKELLTCLIICSPFKCILQTCLSMY